jgi:Cobalamin biosynthesis protein CobN and related Mg-chelatases
MYVADTKNVGQNARFNTGKIFGMKEYLNIDLESRYLNEKWIQGMMESGYSGSTMYSEFVDNLFGWAVTSDGELVSFKNWESVYDIYVNDKYNMGLSEYFKENPFAYQSITARMLETIRHDLMLDSNLTGEQREAQMEKMNAMQDKLMTEYIDSVIANGVACCHHTCGNPKFSEFVDGQMSVLSADPDNEQYKKYLSYKEILEQAVPPKEPTQPTTPTSSTGSGGYGTATVSPGTGQPAQAAETPQTSDPNGQGYGTEGGQAGNTPTVVTGYEMTMLESVTGSIKDFMANPSVSASSIVVIGGIILLVGAVFYGFRRRNI